MRDSYKILASDREEIERHQRKYILMFVTALIISLCLFTFPIMRDYLPKYEALKATQKLSLYISDLKTMAIMNKKAVEIKFIQPDIIEVSELLKCSDQNQKIKISMTTLSEFGKNIIFVDSKWIFSKAPSDEHFTIPPVIDRFCYDPIQGSSVGEDLKRAKGSDFVGSLFISSIDLIKKLETERKQFYIQDWLEEWAVELDIQDASAEIRIL